MEITRAPKTYIYFNREYDSPSGSVHITNKGQRMQPLQENEAHIFQSKTYGEKHATMDYKRCNFYIQSRDKDDKVIRIYDKDAHMELNNREWVWKEPKRGKAGEWETGWVLRKTWGLRGMRLQDLDSWKDGWIRFVAVEAKDHDDFVDERWVKEMDKVNGDAEKKMKVQTSVEKTTRENKAETGERRLERDSKNKERRLRSKNMGGRMRSNKEETGKTEEKKKRGKTEKTKKREKTHKAGKAEKGKTNVFKGLTRAVGGHRSSRQGA
jgi:hypothetical protein